MNQYQKELSSLLGIFPQSIRGIMILLWYRDVFLSQHLELFKQCSSKPCALYGSMPDSIAPKFTQSRIFSLHCLIVGNRRQSHDLAQLISVWHWEQRQRSPVSTAACTSTPYSPVALSTQDNNNRRMGVKRVHLGLPLIPVHVVRIGRTIIT